MICVIIFKEPESDLLKRWRMKQRRRGRSDARCVEQFDASQSEDHQSRDDVFYIHQKKMCKQAQQPNMHDTATKERKSQAGWD